MKKNVFSRTIAVLASMTVLGAASMMSASAKGIVGTSVEVPEGTTSATVSFCMDGVSSSGAEVTITAAAPLTVSSVGGAMASEPTDGGFSCVFVNGGGYTDGAAFTDVKVDIAPDAAPGEYPVNISITNLDDGGVYVDGPTAAPATVVIVAEDTEPEPEETEPTTTAAPEVTTVAATTTTAAKKASPKTGSTGVAVAVAGLVTAGATAVVLKKKH